MKTVEDASLPVFNLVIRYDSIFSGVMSDSLFLPNRGLRNFSAHRDVGMQDAHPGEGVGRGGIRGSQDTVRLAAGTRQDQHDDIGGDLVACRVHRIHISVRWILETPEIFTF